MAEKKLNGTVIVTYRCNARCSMCNRYKAPSKQEEEISLETIKKLPKMYFTNITGGEPFIQPTPLSIMAKILRAKGYNIWAYSGFVFDKLANDPQRRRLLELCDVVVDGPFVLAKKSLELDFRGSSNQRIINVQESLKQNKVILMEGFK